jgi:hypothetical protein
MPRQESHLVENGRLVASLRRAVVGCNLNHVPQTVRAVIAAQAWKQRWEGAQLWTLASFRDFIVGPVPKGGLEWNPKLVQGLLHKSGDLEAEKMFRQAMTARIGHPSKGDIVTIKPERGNSRAYTLARLDCDRHRHLYRRVIAGELSANAAAIQAGLRHKRTAYERILALLPALSLEERQRLMAELVG